MLVQARWLSWEVSKAEQAGPHLGPAVGRQLGDVGDVLECRVVHAHLQPV